MNVSVVICAYTLDRWHALEASVQSCFDQTEPPSEIVVVIDYNDELFDRARAAFGTGNVVKNSSAKGLSGARNSGVAASSGEVVAFLDDDAFADPTWLEELTKPLINPLVCGTGGWVVPFWETGEARWFPETFYWILGCSYSGLPMTDAPIRNPIGASMAIRRGVFDAVGGFTSGIGRIGATPLGCEETELCIRYATQHPNEYFMLARRALVHHRVPSSRLNWHYFWTRCWAEGLSKAAVSSLVGSNSGLAAERSHLVTAIPREIARSLRSIFDEPRAALTRASLIVAGTLIAAAGFLKGTKVLRRSPLAGANDQSTSLASLSHMNRDAEPSESRSEDRRDSRGPVSSIDES
jgi:GT2 family glycosyltransferase